MRPEPAIPAIPDARDIARVALKRHDYPAAIRCLKLHLLAHPDDVEAEIELGLAHYLNGDEAAVLEVHDRVADVMTDGAAHTGHLARLWETYRGVVRRLAKAAAILAVATVPLGAAGCPKDDGGGTTPEPPPRRGVVDAAGVPDAAPEPPPQTHLDAGVPDAAPPPPDAKPITRPRPRPPMMLKYGMVRPAYMVRPPVQARYRVVRPPKPKIDPPKKP